MSQIILNCLLKFKKKTANFDLKFIGNAAVEPAISLYTPFHHLRLYSQNF